MTTIAWDGETIAADTLCSDQFGMIGYTSKIKVLETAVVAYCGDSSALNTFLYWNETWNRDPEKWPKSLKNSSIIYISDGMIFGFEGEKYPTEYLYNKPIAWGSGGSPALALMYQGYDAIDAVKGASDADIYTGGEVEHYRLG